jgi:hypothetical protein
MGMIERRQSSCFAFKARQAVRIAGHVGVQHLDGHVAAQAEIPGAIHLAHRAASDKRDDLIRSEFLSRGLWHGQALP